MAIDPLPSGSLGLTLTEQRALTVTRQGSGRSVALVEADRHTVVMRASTADRMTIVSEIISANADGSVTTVITYRDGHSTTTTRAANAANLAAYARIEELQPTGVGDGHLLNMLI